MPGGADDGFERGVGDRGADRSASRSATATAVVRQRSKRAPSGNPASSGGALPTSRAGPTNRRRGNNDGDAVPAIDLRPSKDISLVTCATERELQREFDNIQKILSDQKQDWNHRMATLKRMQGVVLGCAKMEHFLPLALRLREALLTQVQDLRSAIAREACSVLFVLVNALGSDFEPFALAALPVLFKMTFVTIHVVAESGYQCIRAIVRECRTMRVVGTLLEQLSNRNATLRLRCCQSLLLALQLYPVSVLERHVDGLEAAVRQCLEDAREDVRAGGRQCFWAFREVFEERGLRLYARLDSTKQRAIESERPDAESCFSEGRRGEAAQVAEFRHAGGNEAGSVELCGGEHAAVSASGSRAKMATGAQAPSPAAAPAAAASATGAPAAAPATSTATRSRTARSSSRPAANPVPSTPESAVSRRPSGATPGSAASKTSSGAATSARPSSRHPGDVSDRARSSSSLPPASNVQGPGNSASAPSTPAGATASPTAGTPSRIPTPAFAVPQSFPKRRSREEESPPDLQQRPPAQAASVSWTAPPVSHTKQAPARPTAASGPIEPGLGTQEVNIDIARSSLTRLCHLARQVSLPGPTRSAALCALAEHLQEPSPRGTIAARGRHESPVPADEAFEAAMINLGDAPEVASSALSVLQTLLSCTPDICTPHLDRVLVGLLGASLPSGGSCSGARPCLNRLLECQAPEAILDALGSLLSGDIGPAEDTQPDEAIRLAALELLEKNVVEVPRMCDYLAGRSKGGSQDTAEGELAPMRRLVEDLLRCSGAWPPLSSYSALPSAVSLVRRATSRALHALFLHETHAFLAASAELHPAPRDALVNLMAHLVPELSDSLACYRASSGTPEAPNDTASHERRSADLVSAPAAARPAQASASNLLKSKSAPTTSGAAAGGGLQASSAKAPGPSAAADASEISDEFIPPPRDATGKPPTISMLLTQCGPSTQRATLRSLAMAARTEGQQAWEKHFGRVLILVLDSLTQKDIQGVRDSALLCLQELVSHQPSFFNDFAEVVASKLFDAYRCCGQGERQTATSIDRTLERLIGVVEPTRGLEILLPVISAEGVPLLQAATRLLSSVLQRMPPQRVLDHLDVVLPGVVAAFGNPSSEVRKAAVFCLVDVYMILGEQVMPHLIKDLTPSQMKLVTIYISRQQREREELNHAGTEER